MKRPEKKELSNEGNRCVQVGEDYLVGYNQACDDWEKYWEEEHTLHIESEKELCKLKESLPTVEELETFIESRCGIPIIVTLGGGNLAEDIHKRLIGECNHVFVSAHNAGTKDIAMECGNCGKIIKPEKKEISCEDTSYAQLEGIGYNQACDEHTPYITYLINRIEDLEHKLEYQRIRPNNA